MNSEFWPWWLGGLVLGGVASLYPLVTGRLFGVSSLYGLLFRQQRQQVPLSELEAALLAETEAEFGPGSEPAASLTFEDTLARLRAESERFRPLFLVGMVVGAVVASLLSGAFSAKLTLGRQFNLRYGEFDVWSIVLLAGSGVLIGLGTRLGGGCTSGHGISGVARGEAGSLLTTAVFWTTALLVAWAFRWLGVE
jgi:uncharacterized membrane protein YedE/YeeE